MTPEAQRIAIAEACGWKLKQAGDGEFHLIDPTDCIISADWEPNTTMTSFSYKLPDYLNDLNAIHEAEKVCIVGNHKLHNGDTSIEQSYIWRVGTFSTAAQRAEAFLRTLGLWKE